MFTHRIWFMIAMNININTPPYFCCSTVMAPLHCRYAPANNTGTMWSGNRHYSAHLTATYLWAKRVHRHLRVLVAGSRHYRYSAGTIYGPLLYFHLSPHYVCVAADKVKSEGAKRSAADAMADSDGDVQVTSKPAEETESFSRPAKRGKGPAGEEDVEVIGRNGVELPHIRSSCPEVRVMRSSSRSRPAV